MGSGAGIGPAPDGACERAIRRNDELARLDFVVCAPAVALLWAVSLHPNKTILPKRMSKYRYPPATLRHESDKELISTVRVSSERKRLTGALPLNAQRADASRPSR
jgi:hypothetical protein